MKFIFIRHAESEGNKASILAGPEVPLSPEGIVQANEAADRFAVPIDIIYASPWKRALQTAEPFAQKLGLAIQLNDDLHEKEYGSLTGRPNEELHKILDGHPEYRDPRLGWNYNFCGGESGLDVQKRLLRFIDEMKQKNTGKTILAFSHAGFIRVTHFTFGDHELAHKMLIPNVSIHEFDL